MTGSEPSCTPHFTHTHFPVSGIELFQTTFAGAIHYGVFCRKTVITKGSVFGPFRGKQVNTSEIKTNDDNSFMWEVSALDRDGHVEVLRA